MAIFLLPNSCRVVTQGKLACIRSKHHQWIYRWSAGGGRAVQFPCNSMTTFEVKIIIKKWCQRKLTLFLRPKWLPRHAAIRTRKATHNSIFRSNKRVSPPPQTIFTKLGGFRWSYPSSCSHFHRAYPEQSPSCTYCTPKHRPGCHIFYQRFQTSSIFTADLCQCTDSPKGSRHVIVWRSKWVIEM